MSIQFVAEISKTDAYFLHLIVFDNILTPDGEN